MAGASSSRDSRSRKRQTQCSHQLETDFQRLSCNDRNNAATARPTPQHRSPAASATMAYTIVPMVVPVDDEEERKRRRSHLLQRPATRSSIGPQSEIELLRYCILSPTALQEYKFVTQLLEVDVMREKVRCSLCLKLAKAPRHVNPPDAKAGPKLICFHHAGKFENKRWACCGASTQAKGCVHTAEHTPWNLSIAEIVTRYQYHPTPTGNNSPDIRPAVAIDCEMGVSCRGDVELIRVSVVDYISGETLVDSLVLPMVPMSHYSTRFSGVTAAQMRNAKRTGHYLAGARGAREAIFQFVGPKTIVIGHSITNDFEALQWMHTVVVDTWVLEQQDLKRRQELWEAEAQAMKLKGISPEMIEIERKARFPKVAGSRGPCSLKGAAAARLGRTIQTSSRGHCSTEDAIATKDLAKWHAHNKELLSYF